MKTKKSAPKKSAPKKSVPKKSVPKKSIPKKSASKKSVPKKSVPKKSAAKTEIVKTQKQINREHITKIIHKELKIPVHKSGYYKKSFTKNIIQSLKIINPEFDKKSLLARRLNISPSTLSRLEKGKKVSSKTYKKISERLNKLSAKTQIEINLIADKIHSGIKNPDIKKIDKKVKAIVKKFKQEFETIDIKGLYIYLSYEGSI